MGLKFERVAIIGVGLLGSSMGLGLKARGLASFVVGVGRGQPSLDIALRIGAIDEGGLSVGDGVAGADLIVISTPAAQVIEKLDEIRGACRGDAIVVDVASTKAMICKHASSTWSLPRRFVGCHPMAGSEKFGPEHGCADFYERSVCLVESGEDLDSAARATVVALWEALGAEVLSIAPDLHDALLASTSHIPHVLASALASFALEQGDIGGVIGNGFRDMTRIARSRPEVWRDICLTNRQAVAEGLDAYASRLEAFRESLLAGDGDAVERFFAAGKAAREEVVDS